MEKTLPTCSEDRTIFCVKCQEYRNLSFTIENDTQDNSWAEYSCDKCGSWIDFENPDIHKNLDQKFNGGSWCYVCQYKQPLRAVGIDEFAELERIHNSEYMKTHYGLTHEPNQDGEVGVCIHCWLKMYAGARCNHIRLEWQKRHEAEERFQRSLYNEQH